MTAEKFINGIYKECVTDQLKIYENLLENTPKATDPTWIDIINIYKNLSVKEKKSFIDFLKIVEVNTVASILSIIDGDKPINNNFLTFELKSESGENMSGDLTYRFLEKDDLI
ncbi:hypothetical protein PG593_08640 [Riemerella anatipestifer]|uniref:hypothetical protein n=1 Tax=Riemerella anatipestifer TaxID=34085 RepID=UPI002A85B488|nr:hypothetical protein [Riemerella anatipestifer]MDY3529841.1 hypothetical protein [Riemerella anatipestifer]MDY3538319.1 hypothetical protein [Riemerella anatipestifer]